MNRWASGLADIQPSLWPFYSIIQIFMHNNELAPTSKMSQNAPSPPKLLYRYVYLIKNGLRVQHLSSIRNGYDCKRPKMCLPNSELHTRYSSTGACPRANHWLRYRPNILISDLMRYFDAFTSNWGTWCGFSHEVKWPWSMYHVYWRVGGYQSLAGQPRPFSRVQRVNGRSKVFTER